MKSPFRIPTKVRIAFSKIGSLLLLFQKTPLVQILLPEARVLGTSGVSEVVKWSVATIAGLGAFDTVAGATAISQVSPSPNATAVPARTGTNLTFLVQVTGAPSSRAGSWELVGALPPGLVHANKVNSSTDSITGIPTSTGSYPITIRAWENPGYNGGFKSQAFTIVVTDGGGSITAPTITGQPASATINSGGTTTLTIAASGTAPTFQWYRGNSGTMTNPVSGATSSSFTTPALTATTSYWARASNSAGNSNSNTATVTVITPPTITTQPASISINTGATTTLTVAASGSSPSYQWYRGASGNVTNPISGATAASFTTPALTSTTTYWARAANAAGNSDSNTATITVTVPEPLGAGPFKVGEPVRIDLRSLITPGQTLKLIGKLPKGLKLNVATGDITGTVTGLSGTYPIKFSILQGKTLVRTVDFPLLIAGSAFFAGKYEALLESNAALPTGAFKLLFKKGNTWSATLESPGAKARKAAGKVVLVPGTTAGTLTATFAASGSTPAVTLNATLDLESPIFSGTYNGGTVRGFRLAGNNELPPASTTLSLVFEAGVHDGITAPAGIGWANGTIGPSGTATLSGMLGDGTAVNLPIQLSATGQAILWSQPYANTSSYFGGIVTLPALGQTPGGLPIAANAGWFKAPDIKSLSYPAGFPTMEVTIGSSTWIVPATSTALGASLGWVNNNSPAVEIDGAGLSNAAPQLTTPTLPSGFTLDASFNLTAPASPSVVPWVGRASAANGTFTGSFTLPAAFVPDGIAGPAAASGVLLQADSWGTVTGCGLIRIPIAGATGSFRTAAVILNQ